MVDSAERLRGLAAPQAGAAGSSVISSCSSTTMIVSADGIATSTAS